MEKEYFIRWNNGKSFDDVGSFGGTIKINIYTLDRFSIQHVSGSTIPTMELIRLLWSNPIFEKLREYVGSLKRKNSWAIKMRSGMSGCSDYWIQFLDPKTYSVRQGRKIFHSSMYGSFNEDIIDVWSKDIFDLLWWFKENGYFKESFEGNTEYEFEDITDETISRRNKFFKESYDPENGFGGDELIDESKMSTEENDEIIDYSNYVPTPEPDSDDLYQEQELRDLEK